MTGAVAALAMLLLVAGCATSSGPAGGSSSGAAASGSRAHCLVDPNETGARPLIFLLCIQSP